MNSYIITYKTPANSYSTFFLTADSFSEAETWFLDHHRSGYAIIQILILNK